MRVTWARQEAPSIQVLAAVLVTPSRRLNTTLPVQCLDVRHSPVPAPCSVSLTVTLPHNDKPSPPLFPLSLLFHGRLRWGCSVFSSHWLPRTWNTHHDNHWEPPLILHKQHPEEAKEEDANGLKQSALKLIWMTKMVSLLLSSPAVKQLCCLQLTPKHKKTQKPRRPTPLAVSCCQILPLAHFTPVSDTCSLSGFFFACDRFLSIHLKVFSPNPEQIRNHWEFTHDYHRFIFPIWQGSKLQGEISVCLLCWCSVSRFLS